jgi:hypothetical protein
LTRILTTVFLLLSAHHVSAQTAKPPEDRPSLTQTLGVARSANWFIKLNLKSNSVTGRIQASSDTSVVTVSNVNIPTLEVQSIERRIAQRPNAKRGALIGAAIGLGFGTLRASFFESGFEQSCPASCYVFMVGAAGAGGLVGALIGGGIGETYQWSTVWNRSN